MKWRSGRRSDNVVQAQGGGGGGGRGLMPMGGMGLTGIVLVVGIAWLLGVNPLEMLGMLGGDGAMVGQGAVSMQPAESSDEDTDFVRVIMGSTEDVWGQLFPAYGLQAYAAPQMVLYRGSVPTACGTGQSAMGPFYCPGDHRAYLDLGFFQEMTTRFRAGGDFARAYVIAHEIGHHVQNLLGVFSRSEQLRRQGARMEGADGLSVRQELQADCFAGVWAFHAQQQYQWLEPGDIEDAMNAASAVGDDALQKQSRGYAVPDSFTHGTSAQRQRWFQAGFRAGDLNACDTFGATSL